MNPDPHLAAKSCASAVERDGDTLLDLHLWQLGPGHLGAILSVETASTRESADYHALAREIAAFSHLTVEIARRPGAEGAGIGAASGVRPSCPSW